MQRLKDLAAYTLALRNLNSAQAQPRVGESGLTNFSRSAFRAETIRLALWACSASGSTQVFTTRLVHIAAPLLRPQLANAESMKTNNKSEGRQDEETELEGIALETLEELETLGDLSRLPGGFWVPAPIRFVQLESVNRWILLGGRPTRELPLVMRKNVEYSGCARLIETLPASVDLPIQTQMNWCRFPREPVEAWTERILNKSDVTAFDDPEAEFEFYAAGIEKIRNSRSSLQYYRWTAGSDGLPDGRYLVRSKSRFVGVRYRIGELNNGDLVATGALEMDAGDIRRLLYGLDVRAGCPVTVEACQTRERWQFLLKNELPKSEYRLLRALGEIKLRADGKYYPQLLTIKDNLVGQAIKAFEGLRVTIKRVDKFKHGYEFVEE